MPNNMRSESTENEEARRELPRNPPVTIMEDIIGGFVPSKGNSNAFREAIRQQILQKMLETGNRATSNYGPNDNYGK